MKTPFLEEKYCLEREYYPNGSLKAEKYMVHMAYIVYRYAKDGTCQRIVINGTEYPPSTKFRFTGKELEIMAET